MISFALSLYLYVIPDENPVVYVILVYIEPGIVSSYHSFIGP